MRKKLGDWILDVAKYILTVGILAPLLKVGYFDTASYYIFMGSVVVVLLIIGLFFSDEEGKNKTKKNK